VFRSTYDEQETPMDFAAAELPAAA